MIVIYDREGTLATLDLYKSFKELFSGTEEERLIHIANATLPDGTKFEVSPFEQVDMEDRTVGSGWIYKSTARERTSVAFSEVDQGAYDTITQNWYDTGRGGNPL